MLTVQLTYQLFIRLTQQFLLQHLDLAIVLQEILKLALILWVFHYQVDLLDLVMLLQQVEPEL